MNSKQLPNKLPDIDLLSKTLLSTFAKCSNQNDETEFVLPTEYNMMELLNHIVEFIKPTTDAEVKEIQNVPSVTDPLDLSRSERAATLSTSPAKIMPAPQVQSRKRIRTINLEDEPLDLSPPAKRFPVQQRSSVIFRTPEVQAMNSSELETNTSRNDKFQDQGFPFSLKSVAQKMPKVYIDPMGIPRIEMIEQKSLVSGMQRPSKPVLSVPKLNVTSANSSEVKSSHTVDSSSSFSVYPTSVPQKSPVVFLDQIGMPQTQMTEQKYMSSGMQQHLKRVSAASLVSPKDIPPNNHDSLRKSLATTSQKSSAVLSDQMKILRHKLMEPQKTDSGMQEKPMPVSKANVLVPATNATSPQETELMPTTIPLAPTIILDTQGVANLKVKKPERNGDSMTQNRKITPTVNPASSPSSPTSNASSDSSRLASIAGPALSSPNSSANATPSSPTSQNQSKVPISGKQLVPFDASRASVSKRNTVPQVTHQRMAPVPQPVPGPFLNPFGQPFPMQGGQKMQVHSNFAMHPAHLPYPTMPGFMGHPAFVPPMMFPPHPQMFHPYHPMPAFSFFHPQMIPPPHMIVPSPVSDIFQPADEVLQYLLNDLKDKELLNRLRHVPEPLPEAFWIGLREDTTAKTRVIENMGSKLCGDFRNCAFMSQAKSEVIGKKHGVSGQVICSAYARYRFCNRRSGYFRVREKLDHFHCVRLRKSLKLLWSGESAENVLAELRRADDPFPLLEILEAERRKGIIYTMNFYKERLLKRKKRNMNPLLNCALKEPSAEEVDNEKNIPFELIRVVRLLLHFKSYEAVTEHLIENPSSLLLPNVVSDSIVKKEPLDEEPDEQYTQFIRNYYRLSSENWDNSQSQ